MINLPHDTLSDKQGWAFLVEEFWSESETDAVGLWEIAKEVEERLGTNDTARERSLSIVRTLLLKGLLAGDPPYRPDGYQPWSEQEPGAVVDRIRAEWLELGHTPSIPDIVWFARPDRTGTR